MTIVPSGGMEIRRSGQMKAYLGSCVGLAIFDSKRRIGGMFHILLPEPLSDIPDSQFTYYASTGIPLFLRSLAEEGAAREDMSAYIAGGALIDPNSQLDLTLNIGGRTLDTTLMILKQNGISIRVLEASGVIGSCIMLDVDRATCTIEPIFDEVPKKDARPFTMPSQKEIGRTIEGLQPIPQIALGIAGMISDDRADIDTIASEIRKDQVLTAEVLKLCNSSYLGIHRMIETINEAVMLLGSKTLLQLVVTAQAEKFLNYSDQGYSLMRGGLFYHALAIARLSERLARYVRTIRPDLAYTAGLLHDIGKVVLDQYMARVQPLFYRMMQTRSEDSSTLEEKVFGIDHTLAGLHLAESWKLPEVIKDVVLFHHYPDKAVNNRELVRLVYLADALAQKFLPGCIIEDVDTTPFEESMKILGLNPRQVSESLGVLTDIF
ncbi:MAG TPA: HDOD domain-containing protein [Deltaproteobacteria bacterium]|nr:HDOD domain-containing protein [Deltaproteobacteria bacterium]